MDFKVTHVTPTGEKRCLLVRGAANVTAAMDWVEQLLGPARTLAAIHIQPTEGVR